MASSHEGTPTSGGIDMSNFAHVVFQNVGKSYLPHAALECHYSLSQFIRPHHKDWVGIFKVGWSSARDYYTFLWSPFPENYTEGAVLSRAVVFQGYYVPSDDGEFYQFCYVTHKGEIRGASTPFLFRTSSHSDELLTVEEESNSDMLVVTTRAGLLEKRVLELQQDKEALVKEAEELLKEKQQVVQEQRRVCEKERELCGQLRKENQELQRSMCAVCEEAEEAKRRLKEETSRVLQLQEDLMGVTQKGIQKETELDGLRDRRKKLLQEKDTLESQLKNERDEKELYKIHLKSRELENTKLAAELQALQAIATRKENSLVHMKEELGHMKIWVAEKEKLQKEILSQSSDSEKENGVLKEQLHQTEQQLNDSRLQASTLSSQLTEVTSVWEHCRAEVQQLRESETALRAELEESREAAAQQRTVCSDGQSAELVRELEDLRLRLRMAAEHYKEKYKECQKLQRQMSQLCEQQGPQSPGSPSGVCHSSAPVTSLPMLPSGNPASDSALSRAIQEKFRSLSKEATEKNDKYRKCKQMLSEEKERSSSLGEELSKIEAKLKEQLKMNGSLKLQLVVEEDRYKSQLAEKGREVKELRESLAMLQKEKVQLQEEVQRGAESELDPLSQDVSVDVVQPVFLHYPLPYTPEPVLPPLVPQLPTELEFGNPYSTPLMCESKDEDVVRPPLAEPHSWDQDVVCVQATCKLSRSDGQEDICPSEQQKQPNDHQSQLTFLEYKHTSLSFDASAQVQKRCPLCEVIFPPNYAQSKFEDHVESHWKVCPMCSEQFPLDCEQRLFEVHVLTHFSGDSLVLD